MSHLTTIEKLGKDNFDTWKLQIEAILIKNDHWDYVTGIEAKPAEGSQDEKKWIQNDLKARADIILAINPSELCYIKHCATSNAVWNKLKDVYESKGPAKKATLLKQLLFRKMSTNESMSEHLNIFSEIVDKLNEMDIQIAEDLLSILLLYSIPENFENFRCAIESRDELPKPEALKIKMLEEWEARKGKTCHDSQNAYYTENKRSSQEQKKTEKWKVNVNKNLPAERNYRNFKCNYCLKIGHKASECRKKLADKKFVPLNKLNQGTMMVSTYEEPNEEIKNVYQSPSPWCLDSGCTSHMCNDRNLFTEFRSHTNSSIQLAVDKTAKITGIGTVLITVPNGNGITNLTLNNVLCVPELKCNLLSTSKATANNRSVIFKERFARVIEPNGSILVQAVRHGDLYYVHPRVEAAAIAKVSHLMKWHLKLGHLNECDLKRLKSNDMVRNLHFNDNETVKDCKICIQGKQTVRPFSKESKFQSNDLLNLVHSDLCGPMRVPSHAGSRYFATFIDDKSRYIEVSFLKTKDEVKNAFIKYKAAVENRLGKKIKTLRTDNGLEYCGEEFNKYLQECGIKREFSAPMTPQQNSRAERANRTLTEMARCLLLQSNLPQSFWAEALNCAVYIRNRCPSRSLNENKTPYEMFFGIKPTLSYFKIFGQKCFVLNKKPNKGKFDPRSEEHIFVGYCNESKAYRLWNKHSRKIIISRDVRFINEFENNIPCTDEIKFIFPFSQNNENSNVNTIAQETETSPAIKIESSDTDGDSSDEMETETGFPPTFRSRGRPRKIKTGNRGRPKKEYKMFTPIKEEKSQIVVENLFSDSCPEFSEVLNGPFKNDWKEAIELEFNSLMNENAWEIVDRPKNKKIIGCKWVLKTKYKQDGSIEKLKARLVAKGCSQKPGIDFEENFSPVARLSSIRTAIAYGIQNDFTAYQLDFIMAYVNGDLTEEIYMELPEGFKDDSNIDKVCLLKKSLYGLKQSGRQWFKKLDEKLKLMKFESLNADKCIYFSKSPIEAIIIVYVDDLIILTKCKQDYDYIKDELAKSFKMKDLGLLHYCLGMEFMQNRDSIQITQKKYVEDILSKFNMQESKPIATPFDNNVKLTKDMCPKTEGEKSEMTDVPYRQLIGSLMYLSVATRPDITHAVNFLSQFNNNPGKPHWVAAKRVLRYLKGTQNQGLTFKRDAKADSLIAFVDADWASDVNDRKSFTGYVFKYAGGAISWESRKQQTVALSTTEAEYMALTEAAKETLHLRRFLNELSPDSVTIPTLILCDSQSAQKLVRNPVYHSRTKHIDIRHHFVREIYNNGDIDVKYLETENMPADILTKALNSHKHYKCCELIGLNG